MTPHSNAKSEEANEAQLQKRPDDGKCPNCQVSLLFREMSLTGSDREAHLTASIEEFTADSRSLDNSKRPDHATKQDARQSSKFEKPPEETTQLIQAYPSPSEPYPQTSTGQHRRNTAPIGERPQSSSRKSFLSKLGINSQTADKKIEGNMIRADELMTQRWGPPGTVVRDLVMRYWIATRIQQHWEHLGAEHPRQFKRFLNDGYMEPIPLIWVQDRRLDYINPPFSAFKTPAEERLYYLFNNGVMPDGSTQEPIRPFSPKLQMNLVLKRGNARIARQVPLNHQLLAAYSSPGDVFQTDYEIKSHQYSHQAPNFIHKARSAALHELAECILDGTDCLETMLLIDVSDSMNRNPQRGMVGPDGHRRHHDQPANIRLLEHLVHRILHHMVPRAQREHPQQTGIDTCVFATSSLYVGQLHPSSFHKDWQTCVRRNLGGSRTQILQGWQTAKTTFFEHQHTQYGHGRYDSIYGWQPTPGMPKLSLLIFLGGEPHDMEQFELELLGEPWAYITLALIGMENCPHNHSFAIELERVAKFNPRVGFVDFHGRVCERMAVEQLLGSVYPVDAPLQEEILRPKFDLKACGG